MSSSGRDAGHRLLTSSWALSCIAFATAVQSQSRFRYLGEEEIDSRRWFRVATSRSPAI
jgi:hypothetical protein